VRILVSCYPMAGHVNTVLPVALAAQRAGHEVVVATGPDLVPHVERHGLRAWAVGPTFAEAGGVPDAPGFFAAAAGKRAVDLVPLALGWRPDVVVHEELEFAGAVAAARTGARHVVHGLGLMPPAPLWQAVRPGIAGLGRRWDVPHLDAAVAAATFLEICPPSLRPPGERVWPDTLAVRPVAGLAVAGERLPDAVTALPHGQTVHLTLGTVFHGDGDVLEAAITGLRELPLNLVVTVGPGTDPARFGTQPRHVLVTPYLPHGLLLPRCALVISQGGAGILFGALAHGIPQLVLPQGADQFGNADACRSAGAALVLTGAEVTPGAVAGAAIRLLGDPGFTVAARRVRAEIDAMPSADAVIGAITAG